MADKYTSKIALVLSAPAGPIDKLVEVAIAAGDIDRATPVRDEGTEAMEVNWGGRMQRAVIRRVTSDDGRHMVRTEAYIGDRGPRQGIKRQAGLLQVLARHLDAVTAVVDLDAEVEHELAWLHATVVSGSTLAETVGHSVEGTGLRWVHTHGAARFDIPDLELYAVSAGRVEAASAALRHVHEQLLVGGLTADLTMADGVPVYLVPVRQAWLHCEMGWPGVGRAGEDRGPGLNGPRASLSLLHRPRFGKFKVDLSGFVDALAVS